MVDTTHERLILDQFTRQATPFSTAAAINDPGALQMLVDAAATGADDVVLDVACGGGIVVCAFAPHVRHVTGIDLTPAMLERGRALAKERGLDNVSWQHGDVSRLPWPDGAFSSVATRFSFHHFVDPAGTLVEMARVCRPGGRVVVADMYASDDPAKAAAWNRLETLRDPSHVRCLTLSELVALFPAAGLPEPRASFYELRGEVENLLARSFPNPGDEATIRGMFAATVEDDRLGIEVRRESDALRYAYPVAILAARRA
ncbi:MAG: methyltransferase domain-containing protein [Pseudomonadota bacterium]|nr:methyltransferase domain-containing protein [Pseudomonadota bacterium]